MNKKLFVLLLFSYLTPLNPSSFAQTMEGSSNVIANFQCESIARLPRPNQWVAKVNGNVQAKSNELPSQGVGLFSVTILDHNGIKFGRNYFFEGELSINESHVLPSQSAEFYGVNSSRTYPKLSLHLVNKSLGNSLLVFRGMEIPLTCETAVDYP